MMRGSDSVTCQNLRIPDDALRDFCRRWKVKELALFGSVLRPDFRPDSDVDVLITFGREARLGLLGLVTMGEELERIIGRKVDLVSRAAVERSQNWIRKKAILESAQVIYAEG
jgi:predicted nucleotidyltransferase